VITKGETAVTGFNPSFISNCASNFRSSLGVTSLKAATRFILGSMGLDHTLIEFLVSAAVGAATVLLVIIFVGVGIPRRSPVRIRRQQR
jgi:hypothetical protein